MFEMTYNDALEIQAAQVKHYRENGALNDAGVAELIRRTLPCPFNPDELRPVREINRLVPRGGGIEIIIQMCR